MNKVVKHFRGNSRGAGLLEVIITLAILGVAAITFLSGVSVALRVTSMSDERSTAQSLAESQVEYVKVQDYRDDGAYAEVGDMPDGYDVDLSANELYDGLQEIAVTVKHHGNEVFTLEDYKVDR